MSDHRVDLPVRQSVPEYGQTSASRKLGSSWQQHLCAAAEEMRDAGHSLSDLQRSVESTWLLLHSVLLAALRSSLRFYPDVSREDLEDLAAVKACDLLARLEAGSWNPIGRHPSEVAAYIRSAARYGLQDMAGDHRRTQPVDREGDWDALRTCAGEGAAAPEAPDQTLMRKEFALALRKCSEHLAPRARRIWFLRVFLGLPTQDIASHPSVGVKPGYVDVLLLRVRQQIKACMDRRGLRSEEIPRGILPELWRAFQPLLEADGAEFEGTRP
jgi:RNA polymerase sigma factor (sigma-70 family)